MPTNPKRLIEERILAAEWSRRGGPPAGDDWFAELADLPPLSVVADRAFPSWVLERRLRFWDALGHRPGPGPLRDGLAGPPMPGLGAEDHAAWVYGSAGVETDDPFVAGLARSLGRPCSGPPAGPDDRNRLEGFFTRWAGPPGTPVATVPPAYSRLEAATVAGDRWFGRRGPGAGWERLHGTVAWAGRMKRRVRP